MTTLGVSLRAGGGGRVEVMLKLQDFATRLVGGAGVACGQELVAFIAESYREVPQPPGDGPSDVWAFTVVDDEAKITREVHVRGESIGILRFDGQE